jgi:hypothetical protein
MSTDGLLASETRSSNGSQVALTVDQRDGKHVLCMLAATNAPIPCSDFRIGFELRVLPRHSQTGTLIMDKVGTLCFINCGLGTKSTLKDGSRPWTEVKVIFLYLPISKDLAQQEDIKNRLQGFRRAQGEYCKKEYRGLCTIHGGAQGYVGTGQSQDVSGCRRHGTQYQDTEKEELT